MQRIEEIAEKVGHLLEADTQIEMDFCLIKKKRTLEIQSSQNCFVCKLDMDISFGQLQKDGTAANKAEVYLLPEEFTHFLKILRSHPIPLPTDYSQWLDENPDLICVYMESVEPPEHFAERLADALKLLKQVDREIFLM